jgi:hypothetical protein
MYGSRGMAWFVGGRLSLTPSKAKWVGCAVAVVHNFARSALASQVVTQAEAGVHSRVPRD